MNALLLYNMRYHHFAAVDKARTAYNVGIRLGDNEGKNITPHLQIAKDTAPRTRRKTKATFLSEEIVPPAK